MTPEERARAELDALLYDGADLAEELESQKPGKKKRRKIHEGANIRWRERDQDGNLIPQFPRSCPSTRNCSANQYRAEREPRPEGDVEPQDPTAVSSRDEHLQRLQDILGSIHLPSCSRPSDWEIRKALSDERESVFDGFFNAIPPTSAVVRDEHGQHQLCEQACLLPTNLPESICACNHPNLSLTAGKPVTLVTINGHYDLCLPSLCCQSCQKSWTPEVVDLLACNYWPATGGSICGDSFQKSYLEYRYCQFEVDKLCRVEHFVCPACKPNMLAVSADGNRKHYRFKKSKGTDEKAFFEGLFLAKDEEVSSFVDKIRSQMKSRPGSAVCGTSKWTAARESSQKSSAKVDEEGLEITVCGHCLLLKGLNMYRGEIYAYPMFLQQEMARTRNVSFFCTDIACRYWPYFERMVEKVPELQDLTKMKPFLSVMHAKAHTWKCEVKWGGRNQVGAGTTIGEEVEQTNSFLSRVALTTKYMTKSG
ncbi:hypothetical protein SKAU_G00020860 [Synaphobranchus kaupii]|uniref:CxC3 like cysteine cluster domain-containing protein n=1 Tax=Synaphobranchus kaupii TaxID=118154 RepID=A0A9Q1GCT9_SYNKA|nr:hypothetical protein SKAU_G00020860 [Synaphobranchus kaupii]